MLGGDEGMRVSLYRDKDRKSPNHGFSIWHKPRKEFDGIILEDEITISRVASILAEKSMDKHKYKLKGLSIKIDTPTRR